MIISPNVKGGVEQWRTPRPPMPDRGKDISKLPPAVVDDILRRNGANLSQEARAKLGPGKLAKLGSLAGK